MNKKKSARKSQLYRVQGTLIITITIITNVTVSKADLYTVTYPIAYVYIIVVHVVSITCVNYLGVDIA